MTQGEGEAARLVIDTGLDTVLTKYREQPEQRERILGSFAGSIAGAVGKQGLPVKITDAIAADMVVRDGEILLSERYIKDVDTYAGNMEKGESAVFGTLARMLAKRYGSDFVAFADKIAPSIDFLNIKDLNKENAMVRAIASSVSSYVTTMDGIKQINGEFPGVRGAIAASFIANAQCPEPRQMFESKNDAERWRAAWSTLVMELLGSPVDPEVYPSDEVREAVQACAAKLNEIEYPLNEEAEDKAREAMQTLSVVFKREEEEEDGGGGEGEDESEDPSSEDINQSDASLDSEDMEMAVPSSAAGTPQVVDTKVTVRSRYRGKIIQQSHLVDQMARWLLDDRLEEMNGQQTGLVNTQIHRIITDARIFSKRRRQPEPPNAVVVICVDQSGSMGRDEPGSRLHSANELHDALVFALKKLDIEVASCLYDGDRGKEYVVPVNLPGLPYPMSAHDNGNNKPLRPGGNGDLGAMVWAADMIEQMGRERGCIIFLADGQFTQTTAHVFQSEAKRLGVDILHVDYLGWKASPFGGYMLSAVGKTVPQLAEPLARELARTLQLE